MPLAILFLWAVHQIPYEPKSEVEEAPILTIRIVGPVRIVE